MKTNTISKEEMLKRVSVFKELKPLPIQLDKNISQKGKDIVYARELLSIIGLEENSYNCFIVDASSLTESVSLSFRL